MASAAPLNKAFKFTVDFEARPGGGLRAHSDSVPGFVLSNRNCEHVLENVEPVLEVILSEMFHSRVKVVPLYDIRDHLVKVGIMVEAPVGKREYVISQLGA